MSGGSRRDKNEKVLKPRSGSAGGEDECAFHEQIDLASVRSDVAAGLKRGDVLDVVMHREGEYEAAVCRTKTSQSILGALANVVGLDGLIACMRAGHTYEARIVVIRGTHCRVLVDRVPK